MQKKSRVDYLIYIYIYIEWRFINSFQKIKKNNGEAINNEHRLISWYDGLIGICNVDKWKRYKLPFNIERIQNVIIIP